MQGFGPVPILYACWSGVSILAAYIISACAKHVESSWPLLDDVTALFDESCVFAVLSGVSGFVLLLIVLVRESHVRSYLTHRNRRVEVHNRLGVASAVVAIGGKLLAAYFPETETPGVHFAGAALWYLGMLLFCYANVYLTRKFKKHPDAFFKTKRLVRLRLWTFLILLVTFLVFVVFFGIGYSRLVKPAATHKLKRAGSDTKKTLLTVSAAFQLLAELAILVYVGSFYYELAKVSVRLEVMTFEERDERERAEEARLMSQRKSRTRKSTLRSSKTEGFFSSAS